VFLDEIESEYGDKVCWLTIGKVLECSMPLCEEFKTVLIERGQPISHSEDANWTCDLALLTDICEHLDT